MHVFGQRCDECEEEFDREFPGRLQNYSTSLALVMALSAAGFILGLVFGWPYVTMVAVVSLSTCVLGGATVLKAISGRLPRRRFLRERKLHARLGQ